ncbi:hypothetical protein OG21DRAFT_1506219 [Imleria badia]|nr:hypothetical protein OG21DRAFT_1506219 [Imleria badia]
MCEPCAGAGFVTRPPPAPIQREPRPASQRTCPRRRGSIAVVSASLLRTIVRRATVTTETKDVEDGLEGDLVYPDDMPVATKCTSIAPESTGGELKSMEHDEFVYPERVPGRATKRTFPHPRSIAVVGASLLRTMARRAAVTTERECVENDSEVDLVYPDDIPVAIQCTSTASASKEEAPKPVEDEDMELELEYPEDATETMQTPSPKPRTRVSPPTTLRQLFKNSLQTIPTLQDITALADKSAPRLCWMPGCNQVLPAQTSMERCVKCSISDWKRRRLASMDTSDISRRPSTSSLTTTTSMEENEVTTMLDETSDVEDDPPPTSSIPGWDSDLTELSSDSESECMSDLDSDSDSDPDPGLASSHGNTTGLTIRIPLLVHRLPPDSLRQKCGNKRCNIALPKDHRWKMCDPCRRAQRVYQRIRLENKRRLVLAIETLESPDLPCRQWRSLSPEMYEGDITLTPETSRPCSVRHCQLRIPLAEVYRWKTCIECRARARHEARRKRDARVETQGGSCQPEVVSRFPAYQNRGALLSSFDAQLKGFAEGQIMYLRARLNESEAQGQAKHAPMVFVFVGEYSIVTGQRDHSERDGDARPPDEAMRQEVSRIVVDLERALRTKFSAGQAFAIDKGGMIMRFTCSLELIAQLRPLTPTVGLGSGPSSEAGARRDNVSDGDEDMDMDMDVPPTMTPPPHPPAVPLVKTLSGELEAVVVPDESHHLFHGRRTVIRYCMFG